MIHLKRLFASILACAGFFVFGACNVIDGADMDVLVDAVNSVPSQDRDALNHDVKAQKAKEYLESFKDSDNIGRVRCMADPTSAIDDDDKWFDMGNKDPTLGDVRNCLKNGFNRTYPFQFGTDRFYSPKSLTYASCWNLIFSQAEDDARKELMRRIGSNDPWDKWTDDFVYIGDAKFFRCGSDRFWAFDPDYIYDSDVQPPDTTQIDVQHPHPLDTEDMVQDEDGVWVQDIDGRLTQTRILVQMIFGLHKMPPILATPVFVDALEESVIVICAGLAPLDTKESWGCASAPGLPGYSPTPSDSSIGGDQ